MRTTVSITILIAISALLALASFSDVAHAESADSDGDASFTMSAIEAELGYVEFDAEPGERLVVNLKLKNTGEGAGVADLFAADAMTLRNGGFGARAIDDERTGPVTWMNYTVEEFELDPDEEIVETVTIDVPDDVEPGEYLTSMVIQGQEATALSEEGAGIQLDQISRHAIAILINIEGDTEYGLELGDAEHRNAGANSAAHVEVFNTGNAMLLPDTGEFVLEDDTGFEMLRRDVGMKVIYAGHDTHFALNLGEHLEPGDYYVSLTLTDERRDVTASAERLLLHVEEPPEPEVTDEDSGVTGLIQPPRLPGDDGTGSWWTLGAIIAAVALLAALIGALLGRRRRQQPEPAMAASEIDPAPAQPTTVAQSNLERATQPSASRKPGGIKPLMSRRVDE